MFHTNAMENIARKSSVPPAKIIGTMKSCITRGVFMISEWTA